MAGSQRASPDFLVAASLPPLPIARRLNIARRPSAIETLQSYPPISPSILFMLPQLQFVFIEIDTSNPQAGRHSRCDHTQWLPVPPKKLPNIENRTEPRTARMTIAGIEAIAHLTMKTTMDKNGILISTTVTRVSLPLICFLLIYRSCCMVLI